jgi:hypothetical protein
MRKKWWIFFVAPPAVVLFTALVGWIVMHLWNWLLPALFGWRTIGFWQALGLLVLCRILIGGLSGGHDHHRCKPRKHGHWEAMTHEEREKFRRKLCACDGDPGEPAGESGQRPEAMRRALSYGPR